MSRLEETATAALESLDRKIAGLSEYIRKGVMPFQKQKSSEELLLQLEELRRNLKATQEEFQGKKEALQLSATKLATVLDVTPWMRSYLGI